MQAHDQRKTQEDPRSFAVQGDPSVEGSTIEGQLYGGDQTDTYLMVQKTKIKANNDLNLFYFIFIYLLSNKTDSKPVF